MAYSKKHRRTLVHQGRTYHWSVRLDDDGPGNIVRVWNEAGTLVVRHHLGQEEERPFIIVSGPDFVRSDTSSEWRCFECPRFDAHGVITPKGVAAMIHWCLSPAEERIPVPWRWAMGSQPDVEGYRQALLARAE